MHNQMLVPCHGFTLMKVSHTVIVVVIRSIFGGSAVPTVRQHNNGLNGRHKKGGKALENEKGVQNDSETFYPSQER